MDTESEGVKPFPFISRQEDAIETLRRIETIVLRLEDRLSTIENGINKLDVKLNEFWRMLGATGK